MTFSPPLNPREDAAWVKTGEWLFAQRCDFVAASSRVDNLPLESLGEVAFAGRSNVGKSSLINALTNQLKLARTSNTPGRTQEINFFSLSNHGLLVDLPGYGYAAASKEKILNWNHLIHAYLKGRTTLRRVYVLVDSRHGLKPTDEEIFDLLDKSAVSYQVILTKADKLKPAEVTLIKEQTLAHLKKHVAAHPEIIVTSSEVKLGIPELRAEIAGLFLKEPRG
jgi:GTP-binding protein